MLSNKDKLGINRDVTQSYTPYHGMRMGEYGYIGESQDDREVRKGGR